MDKKGRFYNYFASDQKLNANDPEGCAARCTAIFPASGLVGFTYNEPIRYQRIHMNKHFVNAITQVGSRKIFYFEEQAVRYNPHSLGNVTICANSAGIGFQRKGPSKYGFNWEFTSFVKDPREPGVGEVKDKIPDTFVLLQEH